MDKTLLLFINREWTNPFLDRVMAIFTSFDVWMPILALAVFILLWRGGFRVRSFVIVTLVTIALTDGIFTQFTKKLVQVTLSAPPEGPVIGRSFPSGHAINNTIIATLAILFFGRWGALYIIPAAIVSYSRIYCGSHWPSDVFVSIVLGIGFSLLIAALANLGYQRFASKWFPKLFQSRSTLFGAGRA
jgi:undecaprenyl-diphosphatase